MFVEASGKIYHQDIAAITIEIRNRCVAEAAADAALPVGKDRNGQRCSWATQPPRENEN